MSWAKELLGNATPSWVADLVDEELAKRDAEIERLKREVEVLRLYGNNDCTAMADAALEAKPL